MKKNYSSILLFMSFFYANILYVSEHKQKEDARSMLIRWIKHKPNNARNKERLVREIRSFIEKNPDYRSQRISFCKNRSLFEHLKYYKKEDCWPQEISLEFYSASISELSTDFEDLSLRQSPIHSDTSLLLSLYMHRNLSPVATRKPSPLASSVPSRTYSSLNLSPHGCGKTNLACAMTCNH